jgi:subtilisin family serine protease
VTGDVVTVTTRPDGHQQVDAQAAAGTAKAFQTLTDPNGDTYVIPSDAVEALAADLLDRRLFNVTQLVKDGRGDADTEVMPVIVSYADEPTKATLTKRIDALPASERGPVTDRLDLAGVRVEKDSAKRFWASVKPAAGTAENVAAKVASNGRVAKVWYDAPVHAALDVSVPQISAPQAWAAGYDGKGTKVAVLDTGADLNHPDIKDRIISTRSFITGEEVADGHGHGTHVASTIAGTGAASGGVRKGVAPGADLIIGKVLDNNGTGGISGIIEGMSWAVDQGADVVSMSLGAATDGQSDILSETVDQLSAGSDTLFVIAAGNDGRNGESTLGSPGIADSALTVGAVSKSDVLADFSSRGPRKGDHAIKPDITAPGVDIVAARAGGTSMGQVVDSNYTKASGTSMATPHVAGAAAILAQRHPDWDGERIKAALTSHAEPASDHTPYEQGNGRVNVAASLAPALELSGSADFGLVEWSAKGRKATRTLTLTNTTTADTTVNLTVDPSGTLPEGALTLSAREVSIPAGGSAEVQVHLDTAGASVDQHYSGRITATTAEGARAHTVFGFYPESERRELTVDFRGRNGEPALVAQYFVMGLDNSYYHKDIVLGSEPTKLRVPPGRYSVAGVLDSGGKGEWETTAQDVFQVPNLDLRQADRSAVVDGARARNLTMQVKGLKRDVENNTFSYAATRYTPEGLKAATIGVTSTRTWSEVDYGVIPWEKPDLGEARGTFFYGVREPLVRATVTRPERRQLDVLVSPYATRFTGEGSYDVVDVGDGSAEQTAGKKLSGKIALVHQDKMNGAAQTLAGLKDAGAVAAIVAPNDDRTPELRHSDGVIPLVGVDFEEGQTLTAQVAERRTTLSLKTIRSSRYAYSGQWDYTGALPSDLRLTMRTDELAKVTNRLNSDGTHRLGGHFINSWARTPITSYRSNEIVEMGHQREEYLRAVDGLQYTQSVSGDMDSIMMEWGPHLYRAGRSYQESWYGTPMHPSSNTSYSCNYCRSDDYLVFGAQVGGDSDPEHFTEWGRMRKFSYYRDGVEITDPSKLIVPQKAQYRFVHETSRIGEHTADSFATTTRTESTFTSAQPTTETTGFCKDIGGLQNATHCEALPVVVLDYDMEADLFNQVKAGSEYSLTVNALRAKNFTGSTAMAGAKVSVSTDDGATWTPAKVSRVDGDSFRASYHNTKTAGTFVSVRAEVWDADGNRTVETVTRAYRLK